MTERQEIYEQLIRMGYSPEEAWEAIAEMDFAEDYDDLKSGAKAPHRLL